MSPGEGKKVKHPHFTSITRDIIERLESLSFTFTANGKR